MVLKHSSRDARHVTLSRALGERLFVSTEGRIFSIVGRPAFEPAVDRLGRHDRPPTAAEAPTPSQLGLEVCDGELTPEILDRVRAALVRRRKDLGVELRRRPAQRREIERLERRLREVKAWSAALAAGVEPIGAPYFLDTAEEAALSGLIGDHVLPPLIAWQARMTWWLSGVVAAHRYLQAVIPLLPTIANDEIGRRVAATVAALVAADGSSQTLPQRLSELPPPAQFELLNTLKQQIGQPAYGALLATVDLIPSSLELEYYGFVRRLLADGNSIADVAWVCERGILLHLPHECLDIKDIRRLDERFADSGWPLNTHDFGRVLNNISELADVGRIEAWIKWLGSVSPRTLTPRLKRALAAAFWNTYLPSVRRNRWFSQLAPWVAPASPRRNGVLKRIAGYQQLLGRAATPKSLRKLLDRPERRRRERDYLRTRHGAEPLPQAAQLRLAALEQSVLAATGDAKVQRAAEEAFLLLGLEAQRTVVERLSAELCREHLAALVPSLTREQLREFAGWLQAMSPAERLRLQTVLAARERCGRTYKRRLKENEAWITAATAQGVNLEPWFAAEPHRETIGGRVMEITVVDDLREIFLMGAYFGTCLSPGDINEMSVLTNAYDANKQVVFMHTEDDAGVRQVVGRQLIAVSSDFKLVGYRAYLSWRHAEKSKRDEGLAALAAYCGRLAAMCGLELADQGTPESIGEHFWYDDGENEWPAAARAAWDQMRNRRPEGSNQEASSLTSHHDAQAG